jgi:hypothetical protein
MKMQLILRVWMSAHQNSLLTTVASGLFQSMVAELHNAELAIRTELYSSALLLE